MQACRQHQTLIRTDEWVRLYICLQTETHNPDKWAWPIKESGLQHGPRYSITEAGQTRMSWPGFSYEGNLTRCMQ